MTPTLYSYHGGKIEVIKGPRLMHPFELLMDGKHIAYINKDKADTISNVILDLIDSLGGVERDVARQDVVNVIGAIDFKAKCDQAYILNFLGILGNATSLMEIEDDLKLAEEIHENIPRF